jgi:multicomponent K+:H+ antiporter subunit D
MIPLADHLLVVPVALPLAVAAALVLMPERRHALKAAVSMTAALALVAAAALLVARADAPTSHVYHLGSWPAPFGIVLVADRLSAAMVLLAAALGAAALWFSLARWHRSGAHFHSLVHLLLGGLSGAFLTGDVFNLFVFFELLLAASYGLALYGGGAQRIRASLHYIVVNLAASLLFLVGVSLVYGVAGTLNMADIAVKVAATSEADRVLAEIGIGVLAVAFFVKAGMWPLGFWLAPAYAAASAPAAALFAVLTKVGIYAVLRLWLLVFGGASGAELLAFGGMATLVFGVVGMLAAQSLGALAGHGLLVSSGTLLAAIGLGGAATTAAGLYYLAVSTLAIAAFFLLAELVERAREAGADVLAVTAEAFGLVPEDEEPEEEVGIVVPGAMALLAGGFLACGLLIAGLPPLAGFLAKFALMDALVREEASAVAGWTVVALLLLSGLATTIAFARAGVRTFWATQRLPPVIRLSEMAPVAALLLVCVVLTVLADPVLRYLQEAAYALHQPGRYVEELLGR